MHNYADWGDAWGDQSHSDDDADCVPLHKYEWCQKYLGECVASEIQYYGFLLGLLSNLCWLVAQGPQIYKNWRNGTSESLSIYFLAAWLTGDITNLVGCLLTDTTRTQLYTAVYFCFIDGIMVSQWIYYSHKNKKTTSDKGDRAFLLNSVLLPVAMIAVPALVGATAMASWSYRDETVQGRGSQHSTSRTLLSMQHIVIARNRNELIGYICGCISGLLYFTSRIPQIVTNFKRKTTEGLEPMMFVMAVCGNLFYAAGVLSKGVSTRLLIVRGPWLLGSIGTLNFDFTIVIQYFYYGTDTKKGCYKGPRSEGGSDPSKDLIDGAATERQALLSPARGSRGQKGKAGWNPDDWE